MKYINSSLKKIFYNLINYLLKNISYILQFHNHECYHFLNHLLRNNDLISYYFRNNMNIVKQSFLVKENNESINILNLKYLYSIFFKKLNFNFYLSNNISLSLFDFIKNQELNPKKTTLTVLNLKLFSSNDIDDLKNFENLFSSDVILIDNIINDLSLSSKLIEFLSIYNYLPYVYCPKNRILQQHKYLRSNNKSVIFIKDFNFVKKRIIQSRKYKFGYLIF